ncbi:unnamed protein product [Parascedosporium putredinis]|uniref:DUF431-domain-containing protein n=1 Tax=Parascedosporium putredinis TaxID=1442378 RepID=A0A9P1M8E4_9PEZI|nr:unnamed protein product [Parascedosporium putredinis]CAI7989982.1 unnamed protein product [Parascedosporium putredinis]
MAQQQDPKPRSLTYIVEHLDPELGPWSELEYITIARDVEDLYRDTKDRVCLLDPSAAKDLSPEDGDTFDVFLFGGILGDDPPRATQKGFEGRRLGPKQMTTDTAVRVTRIVVQDKVPLDKIPYDDFPELKFNEHESTDLPFRYVRGDDGKPIMPEGMLELIGKDADKAIDDLF